MLFPSPLYFSPFRNAFSFSLSLFFLLFFLFTRLNHTVSVQCERDGRYKKRVAECTAANRTCHNNIMPILPIIHIVFTLRSLFNLVLSVAEHGPIDANLPSSHTCLPPYNAFSLHSPFSSPSFLGLLRLSIKLIKQIERTNDLARNFSRADK